MTLTLRVMTRTMRAQGSDMFCCYLKGNRAEIFARINSTSGLLVIE